MAKPMRDPKSIPYFLVLFLLFFFFDANFPVRGVKNDINSRYHSHVTASVYEQGKKEKKIFFLIEKNMKIVTLKIS